MCRVQTEVIPVSQPQSQQCFGKASSVASQNLSIIVEAINHLEGDQRHPNQLKVSLSTVCIHRYAYPNNVTNH